MKAVKEEGARGLSNFFFVVIGGTTKNQAFETFNLDSYSQTVGLVVTTIFFEALIELLTARAFVSEEAVLSHHPLSIFSVA